MLTSQIKNHSDEAIRQMLVDYAPLHTAIVDKPTKRSPFIIDGNFLKGEITLPSGEKRKITGTTFTAINSYTFSKDMVISAIKENRFATFIIGNDSLIKEICIHPEWMRKIRENNAFDILARVTLNEAHSWVKENDDIGIGAVKSQEEYNNMILTSGLLGFLKLS